MDRRSVTLEEFIAEYREYRFWGKWEVSYTDGTHLPEDEYVKLGEIIIDASEETAQNYPILPFTFQLVKGQEIESRFSEIPNGKKQANRESR